MYNPDIRSPSSNDSICALYFRSASAHSLMFSLLPLLCEIKRCPDKNRDDLTKLYIPTRHFPLRCLLELFRFAEVTPGHLVNANDSLYWSSKLPQISNGEGVFYSPTIYFQEGWGGGCFMACMKLSPRSGRSLTGLPPLKFRCPTNPFPSLSFQ